MKRKYIISLLFILSIISSCTNLDEQVFSDIPKDDFFESEKLLTVYAGRAYTKLQAWGSEQSIWTLNIQTSDECAVPRNAVNDWVDPRYKELQTHKFSVSNKLVRMGWDYCFDGIAACNDVLGEIEKSPMQFKGKDKILSEVKILRAFFYFLAVDGWGNIPFSIDSDNDEYPKQKDRKFMCDFIVNSILDNVDNLDVVPTTENYGKVTQGMAYTMLAKIYLNSQEWIGEAKWSEAEAACLKIVDNGNYIIEDKYKTNFDVLNESSRENIFAIPYSTIYTQSDHNDFVIYVMTLPPASSETFNIPATCWDGFICQPDFFNTYDPNDTRRSDTWLYGQQSDINGKLIDGFIINPDFSEDVYSTGRGVYDGAKLWKWTYQTDGLLTGDQISMDNDFGIFRYSDVVLMYAEALVRQDKGADVVGHSDFQKIRTRAGLVPLTIGELTLDNLLLERAHELSWEGWRRQDLIRFGKFNDIWWAKPEVSPEHTKLYPIPRERLGVNPNLKQNSGYTN